MPTVIDQAEEHEPHHDLARAILGHKAIAERIAEHAAHAAGQLEQAREAHSGSDMDGSPASPGTW